jgi:sterol desaturase/sphingolipid hydroxylase (fatty acid hydroxylase superfamily)
VKNLISGLYDQSPSPQYWLAAFIIFYIMIMGRYLLIASLFYSVFYIWFPGRWRERKLSNKSYKPGQLKTEIRWSLLSAAIFSLFAILSLWLWKSGYTKIYTDVTKYGNWWLPFSLLLAMIFQETYYYWLHRLMHQPSLFMLVHKIHHDSSTTSPFTAFSFHPLECLIQAAALPLLLIILPLHPAILLLLLTIMSVSSVINHLNIELCPRSNAAQFIGKWLIGPAHHAKHHARYKYNFGLYFTFWDKLLKTEGQDDKLLRMHSSKASSSRAPGIVSNNNVKIEK